mgnify:CR=1 FL=1
MNAYVFPGQGAQFSGMGKDLYDGHEVARELFDKANEVLGFNITQIMFSGSDEDLQQTKVTQPAIFIHSVIKAKLATGPAPDMVAGHSLGEFSALVAAGCLSYEESLSLVYQRAMAMQRVCELNPSTMAAVLGLEDHVVEEVCASVTEGIVVPANYNCPGQLVISGDEAGIDAAIEKLKTAGAKRALKLAVGGAFHSPLMEPARVDLEKAILNAKFATPNCPIYQNVDAKPSADIEQIKKNLALQLTAPVRWTQTIQNMIADGALQFFECGPGNVLQGLIRKINKEALVGAV